MSLLNKRDRIVFDLLDANDPRHVDDLIERSGLEPEAVLATLLVLEVMRLVRQLPGKRYVKAVEELPT